MIDIDQALERIAAAYEPLQQSRRELQIRDYGCFREGLTPEELAAGTVRSVFEGEHCKLGSANPSMQRFLFETARKLCPKVAVEFGTCFGASAAALGFAMDAQPAKRLLTIEADVTLLEIARDKLEQLGLGWIDSWRCTFAEALAAATAVGEITGVELVYDDGCHTGTGEADRMDQVLPLCADRTVFIWDDIRWSSPMWEWWQYVSALPNASDVNDNGRCGSLVWVKS